MARMQRSEKPFKRVIAAEPTRNAANGRRWRLTLQCAHVVLVRRRCRNGVEEPPPEKSHCFYCDPITEKDRLIAFRAKSCSEAKAARLAKKYDFSRASKRCQNKLREKLFETYGTSCVRCGYSDRRALSLDHVFDNGAAERRQMEQRGVYKRAVENGPLPDYQILCMNCQFIKRHEAAARRVSLENARS